MGITVNLPTGGEDVYDDVDVYEPQIIITSGDDGEEPEVVFPRTQGPAGPQGPPGARYTDLGFSVTGALMQTVTIAVTRETTILEDYCLAEATGTGLIEIDIDGTPVGSVVFPSGDFSFDLTAIPRGFLTFTPSGTLSDLSIAVAGER